MSSQNTMSLNLYINIRKSLVWPARRSTFSMAIFKCFPVDAEALHLTKASMQRAITMVDDHHCSATFTNRVSHSKLQLIFIPNLYLFHTLHELKSIKNHWKKTKNYLEMSVRSKSIAYWSRMAYRLTVHRSIRGKSLLQFITLKWMRPSLRKMVKMLNRLFWAGCPGSHPKNLGFLGGAKKNEIENHCLNNSTSMPLPIQIYKRACDSVPRLIRRPYWQ